MNLAVESDAHRRGRPGVLDRMRYAGREGEAIDLPLGYLGVRNLGTLPRADQSGADHCENFRASWMVVIASDGAGFAHDHVDIALLTQNLRGDRFEDTSACVGMRGDSFNEDSL